MDPDTRGGREWRANGREFLGRGDRKDDTEGSARHSRNQISSADFADYRTDFRAGESMGWEGALRPKR